MTNGEFKPIIGEPLDDILKSVEEAYALMLESDAPEVLEESSELCVQKLLEFQEKFEEKYHLHRPLYGPSFGVESIEEEVITQSFLYLDSPTIYIRKDTKNLEFSDTATLKVHTVIRIFYDHLSCGTLSGRNGTVLSGVQIVGEVPITTFGSDVREQLGMDDLQDLPVLIEFDEDKIVLPLQPHIYN